jgi:hypothetical protein
MSAFYRLTTRVPLIVPATIEQEDAIQALTTALGQCEETAMRRPESPEGGCCWLTIHCPAQWMNSSFIIHLEQLIAKLGPFATQSFMLEYQYEDEAVGVEFFGPTEASVHEAKCQWHQAKAAESLKLAGMDLDVLINALAFARRAAAVNFMKISPPVDSPIILADLVAEARLIVSASDGRPAG